MPLSVLVLASTRRMVYIDGFTAEFAHVDSTSNSLLKFTNNESAMCALGERVLMADGGEAEFAPCSSLILHCSLASGSYLNGSGSQDVVASIALDATPGSQIMYMPQVAPHIPASALVSGVSSMCVALTDQDGNTLDTMGEEFQATMLIEW